MAFGIWNNLDELGLYLGLERISYETDEDYSSRIKQFAIYKYKTDYYTQAHSIPLQLGLSTYEAIRLTCTYETDGESIDVPFQCKVDWEFIYFENFPPAGQENLKEYIRIFINSPDATIRKILNILDNSTTFKYTLLRGAYKRLNCKFLIRNSNVATGRDFVNSKYATLSQANIIDGSFNVEDITTCKKRVASLLDLRRDGDYYIDRVTGYMQTFSDITLGFFVTYQYYKPYFSIEATELNFIPLNTIAKYGITDQFADYAKIILKDKVWGK
jgi:hypothetical protein